MVPNQKSSEAQTQKAKLASSYGALLEEFASKDLRNVGNYAVGSLIGKGSFGKVYLASHKLINGSKVVLKSADKDDSNLAREIHHHRQFLHPHIARLYEVILTERSVWLVLEYCPGDELYYYLTKHGAIEPEKVQKIFTQLLGAVSYVHQKSCVHRDLKLENILLDKSGDVKLCDFGFTREYEGKSSYLQTWCGTVCYSAPEMLKGEKYAGEKVDVWSLGVILYALLCGELPYDEDDDDKTKAKILKEEPKYPETMPKPARDLINSMLSKRPLLRPSLADILTNPWLADYAPHQQAVLKVQQPAPFSTQIETDTLQRMRSAGVNIDAVIENVLSQRCDALAGWWALLLEKEERKERRKLRKRKEREADAKTTRRISNASGRLLAATLTEVEEEKPLETFGADKRGRSPPRANGTAIVPPVKVVSEEQQAASHSRNGTLTRHEFPVHRPSSSSAHKRRARLGPAYSARRNSMLQVVAATEPALLNEDAGVGKKSRRPVFLQNIRSWFKDAAKRTKNPTPQTRPDLFPPIKTSLKSTRSGDASSTAPNTGTTSNTNAIDFQPSKARQNSLKSRPRVNTNRSVSSHRRVPSHSPSPITPRSSYRRSSGLRGRKSTSSSVSSIRSFAPPPGSAASASGPGHHPSHSKASSISSVSMGSPSSLSANLGVPGNSIGPHPAASSIASRRRSSPNNSVLYVHAGSSNIKVLPNSLTLQQTTAAPSTNGNKRPPRISLSGSVLPGYSPNGSVPSAFSGVAPPSPGLPLFAKRRRSPFKGPMLGPGLPSPSLRRRSGGGGGGEFGLSMDSALLAGHVRRSNSGSRKSVESNRGVGSGGRGPVVIEEEDEEEDEEDEFEEVDAFSPIEAGDRVEWSGLSGMEVQFGGPLDYGAGGAGARRSVELEADRPLTKWEVENN